MCRFTKKSLAESLFTLRLIVSKSLTGDHLYNRVLPGATVMCCPEADQPVVNYVAHWTNDDPVVMERLFGTSVLGLWEKWRDRLDYRRRTIHRALLGWGSSIFCILWLVKANACVITVAVVGKAPFD